MEEEGSSESFAFAFNDIDFSDRLLHLQIIPGEVSSLPKIVILKSPTQKYVSNYCAEFQLKSLHLSSPILAAKSPFFYKLFKNGMSESKQKEATLRIHSSEETALMDLLKFMYSNTLSATTFSDLVDVLIAADKFEVKSCIKHCFLLLSEMPMSLHFALSYLEIPANVLAAKPLVEASKEYLVAHFMELHKSREEAMELPLDALEIVLSSETLKVNSEDDVYEFILEWAHSHYPKLEERQAILENHLLKFISFPCLSCSMLRKALVCPDFNSQNVSELVMEALFKKAETSSEYLATIKTRRLNDYPLVKVVPVEFTLPRIILYFNIRKEECMTLVPNNGIISQDFLVGGQLLYFGAVLSSLEGSSSGEFAICIVGHSSTETCSSKFDAELAVMKKKSKKYEVETKERGIILSELEEGGSKWRNLWKIPFTTLLSDKSEYFTDDILKVRAELTFTKSPH